MSDWLYWTLGGLLGIAATVMLVRALFADRSRGRRRCPKCWYDMSGVSQSLQCPECGCASRHEHHFARTRRHWWRVLACIVFLVLPGTHLILHPFVRERGWIGLLPDAAVIAMIGTSQTQPACNELIGRIFTRDFSKSQWQSIAQRCIAVAKSDASTANRNAAWTFLDIGCSLQNAREVVLTIAAGLCVVEGDGMSMLDSLVACNARAVKEESLLRWLKSADPADRQYAAILLAACDLGFRNLGPAMVEARFEKDPAVRPFIIRALAATNSYDPNVALMLADAVNDPDPRVRFQAASGLKDFFINQDEIGIALVGALKDSSPRVRGAAAVVLTLSPIYLRQNKQAIDAALHDAMNDSDDSLRRSAARALETSRAN